MTTTPVLIVFALVLLVIAACGPDSEPNATLTVPHDTRPEMAGGPLLAEAVTALDDAGPYRSETRGVITGQTVSTRYTESVWVTEELRRTLYEHPGFFLETISTPDAHFTRTEPDGEWTRYSDLDQQIRRLPEALNPPSDARPQVLQEMTVDGHDVSHVVWTALATTESQITAYDVLLRKSDHRVLRTVQRLTNITPRSSDDVDLEQVVVSTSSYSYGDQIGIAEPEQWREPDDALPVPGKTPTPSPP